MYMSRQTVEPAFLDQETPPSTADLIVEAESQLNTLRDRSQIIHQLQSSIDLIMQRHHVERSYISRASAWFGRQAWWVKLIIGLTITATALGISAIFNLILAITLGVIAATFYLAIAGLFQNDSNIQIRRDRRLREDLQLMERDLAETVNHLRSVEDSLKKVFISLGELNVQLATDIHLFEQKIASLQERTGLLADVIKKLYETDTTLNQHVDDMKSHFQTLFSDLSLTHQSFSSVSDLLDTTSQSLDKLPSQLMDDHNALLKITKAYHENSHQILTMIEMLQTILPKLQEQASLRDIQKDKLLKKLSVSVEDTLEHKQSAVKTILRAEATMDKVLRELDDYEVFEKQIAASMEELTGKNSEYKSEADRVHFEPISNEVPSGNTLSL